MYLSWQPSDIRYHLFNRWVNACHSPEEGCALVDIERLSPNSPLGSICCSASGNLFSRQSSWKSSFRCKGFPWTNSRSLHPGTYQGGIQNPVNWAQSIKTPRGISAPEHPTELTEAVQACIIAWPLLLPKPTSSSSFPPVWTLRAFPEKHSEH